MDFILASFLLFHNLSLNNWRQIYLLSLDDLRFFLSALSLSPNQIKILTLLSDAWHTLQ